MKLTKVLLNKIILIMEYLQEQLKMKDLIIRLYMNFKNNSKNLLIHLCMNNEICNLFIIINFVLL